MAERTDLQVHLDRGICAEALFDLIKGLRPKDAQKRLREVPAVGIEEALKHAKDYRSISFGCGEFGCDNLKKIELDPHGRITSPHPRAIGRCLLC